MTMSAWKCGMFPCQCGNCRTSDPKKSKSPVESLADELTRTQEVNRQLESVVKKLQVKNRSLAFWTENSPQLKAEIAQALAAQAELTGEQK